MEIIRAKNAGFCSGVNKAYEASIKQSKGTKMLGDLVHNKEVVEELRQKGIQIINTANEAIEGDTVIIRAHGAVDETIRNFNSRCINVVDCTCPKVKRIQKLAKEYSEQGMPVAIFGKEGHAEFESICSFAGENVIKISGENDARDLQDQGSKLVFLAQTTSDPGTYQRIKEILEGKVQELITPKTLCGFTGSALASAQIVAGMSDKMLIIGGKKSSNTKNLYNRCQSINPNSYQVETLEEAKEVIKSFKSEDCIGIAAGASTPESTINSIINYLKKRDN